MNIVSNPSLYSILVFNALLCFFNFIVHENLRIQGLWVVVFFFLERQIDMRFNKMTFGF